MREFTWLDRPVNWSQYRVFQSVMVRYSLCQSWAAFGGLELSPVDPLNLLKTAPTRGEITDFQNWCDIRIGSLSVDEALQKLIEAVRVYQASLSVLLLHRVGIQQVSYESGLKFGQSYFQSSDRLPQELNSDFLRRLVFVLHQSCFGWLDSPSSRPPLIERESQHEISWLILECPHRDAHIQSAPASDWVCRQHLEWFSGFLSACDSCLSLKKERTPGASANCRLVLGFHSRGTK